MKTPEGKPGGPPRSLPAAPRPHARNPRRLRLWLITTAAVVALGWIGYRLWPSSRSPTRSAAIGSVPGSAAGFNVVLFTLDTLRADRVGCYGYADVDTPALDALAADGVRFADAVTPVPITLPAHATILTGDYPPTHGVRDNGTYRLVAERETLAERLKAEGYATAAFIAAFVLDRRYGLDQGFDVYDDRITLKYRTPGVRQASPQRPGNVVTDSAIQWLETQHRTAPDRPFLIWIHLFDPHTPYRPPEPFKSRYAGSPYDGEVAFVDRQVGRFVDRLRELRLLDRTLVVVVGDHGEGLGDHGESTHSLLIYGSTLRVPLIFHAPGVIPDGRVVDDRVVSTVDIHPTILDLLGLDPGECDGVSLARPAPHPDRAVYAETLAPKLNHGWSPLYALRRHHDKYIEAPTPEYYDLRTDPRETHNSWAERVDGADRLQERLATLLASFAVTGPDGDAAVSLDREAIRKLAALGYIQGPRRSSIGPPPDPKEMIVRWERKISHARLYVDQGRHDQAIPLLGELLENTPNDARLWSLLSHAQAQAALPDEALTSRMRAIELQPDDPNYWLDLARLQYRQGDVDAAQVSLAEAEHLEPHHGEVSLVRACEALEAKQYEQAIGHCAEARERDPTRHTATSWSLQGRVWEEMGRMAEAQAAYERAHQADPLDSGALLGMAGFAERREHPARVIELAGAVLRGDAHWPQSRAMLARAYLQLDQGDQAIQTMRELVDAAPSDPRAHNNLGNVLYTLGRLDEAAPCYRTAVDLDPAYVTAQYNLAAVLEAQGDRSAATENLRRVLELDARHVRTLALLATLLESCNRIAEAEQICERWVEAAPHDPRAYVLAANLLDRQGDATGAVERLRRGHATLPEAADIARALAWRLATSPHRHLRDGPEAVRLAEQARATFGSDDIAALDTLAAAYSEAGRFPDAISVARQAVDLAEQTHETDLAAEIATRLGLYESGRPYRRP